MTPASTSSDASADAIGQALVDACDRFDDAVDTLAAAIDIAVAAAERGQRERFALVRAEADQALASAVGKLSDVVLHNSAAVARVTERLDALEQRARTEPT